MRAPSMWRRRPRRTSYSREKPKPLATVSGGAKQFAKTDLGPKNVSIPVAVSLFPDDIIAAPRSWTERAYPNLIHYNQLDKGGHFAAWEQPRLLVDEMRAGLKSLR